MVFRELGIRERGKGKGERGKGEGTKCPVLNADS
jgi:hypothetical protein